jgi:hypothetical protein
MCDYSLELYRTRPASKGERYMLDRFPSGSMGFTMEAGCGTAVCVPADTRLKIEGIADSLQAAYGFKASEEVTMIHLDVGTYRDAVRFANGKQLLLQQLNPGVTASVVAFVSDLVEDDKIGGAAIERIAVDA